MPNFASTVPSLSAILQTVRVEINFFWIFQTRFSKITFGYT